MHTHRHTYKHTHARTHTHTHPKKLGLIEREKINKAKVGKLAAAKSRMTFFFFRKKERERERGRENRSLALLPRLKCSIRIGVKNLFYADSCA